MHRLSETPVTHFQVFFSILSLKCTSCIILCKTPLNPHRLFESDSKTLTSFCGSGTIFTTDTAMHALKMVSNLQLQLQVGHNILMELDTEIDYIESVYIKYSLAIPSVRYTPQKIKTYTYFVSCQNSLPYQYCILNTTCLTLMSLFTYGYDWRDFFFNEAAGHQNSTLGINKMCRYISK